MAGETRTDTLTPALAARYAATFDRPARETGPQGIHWCLTTPEAATASLGPDGHPAQDDYPGLPRRMWASSDVTFHAPIPVGAAVIRTSRLADSTEKSGKSGRLMFVTVAHDITANGAPAVSERQSIVYREPARPGAAPPPPGPLLADRTWDWKRALTPDETLLFRYSALTFNSHRIHYDRPYAMHEEGYPGLVVHGPLMASLLLDLADRELGPDRLASFSFRAVSPAFVGAPMTLLGGRDGDRVDLAIAGPDNAMIMQASATIR